MVNAKDLAKEKVKTSARLWFLYQNLLYRNNNKCHRSGTGKGKSKGKGKGKGFFITNRPYGDNVQQIPEI